MLEDAAMHYRKAIELDSKFVKLLIKGFQKPLLKMGAPDGRIWKKV